MPCPAVIDSERAMAERKRLHNKFLHAIADSRAAMATLLEFNAQFGFLCLNIKQKPDGSFEILSTGA